MVEGKDCKGGCARRNDFGGKVDLPMYVYVRSCSSAAGRMDEILNG